MRLLHVIQSVNDAFGVRQAAHVGLEQPAQMCSFGLSITFITSDICCHLNVCCLL